MKKNIYKIAYLCRIDPLDKRSNSGTQFYMVDALQKQNNSVDIYYVRGVIFELFRRFLFRLYGVLYKQTKMFTSSLLFARFLGIYFTLKLRNKDYDFIFVSRGKAIIPFLKVDIPILYTSDATFKIIQGYYKNFSTCTESQWKQANFLEKVAIKKSVIQMYPSLWAAESAIRDYYAKPDSVFFIPSGANFSEEDVPSYETFKHRLPSEQCHILFVGKNWESKGGNVAYKAVCSLRELGVQATLTVIGCHPTILNTPVWVKVIPNLDKNIPEEAKRLANFFIKAHFFVLPTRYETFGLVFAEACAYALPIIANYTGGVATSVEDGVNGYLLPAEANGEDYAAKIASIWDDKTRYSEFSHNSRKKYDDLLNWRVWGEAVQEKMGQLSIN